MLGDGSRLAELRGIFALVAEGGGNASSTWDARAFLAASYLQGGGEDIRRILCNSGVKGICAKTTVVDGVAIDSSKANVSRTVQCDCARVVSRFGEGCFGHGLGSFCGDQIRTIECVVNNVLGSREEEQSIGQGTREKESIVGGDVKLSTNSFGKVSSSKEKNEKKKRHKANKQRKSVENVTVESRSPVVRSPDIPLWRRKDGKVGSKIDSELGHPNGFWHSCSKEVRQDLIDSKARMHIAENNRKAKEANERIAYLDSPQKNVDQIIKLVEKVHEQSKKDNDSRVLGWAKTVMSSSAESIAKSTPSSVPSFETYDTQVTEDWMEKKIKEGINTAKLGFESQVIECKEQLEKVLEEKRTSDTEVRKLQRTLKEEQALRADIEFTLLGLAKGYDKKDLIKVLDKNKEVSARVVAAVNPSPKVAVPKMGPIKGETMNGYHFRMKAEREQRARERALEDIENGLDAI